MNQVSTTPSSQLTYLACEIRKIVNNRWWRWFTCWFGASTAVVVSYRLDRMGYLLTGEGWSFIRLLFFPVFLSLRLLGTHHDIHYRANIGKGLKVLHPVLGIVVSGHAVIGEDFTVTGGNCIGVRQMSIGDHLIIGNNVTMGANAVILGPIVLGDNLWIGAGAVVVNDHPGNATLVGVPAKAITN